MSIDVVHGTRTPPRPPARAGSWELMEARLILAQVGDLLERASLRLTDLQRFDDTTVESSQEIADLRRSVELGRQQVAALRSRPARGGRPSLSATAE